MGGVITMLKQEHAVVLEMLRRLGLALESHNLPGVLECLRFFDEELALHRRKEEEILLPEITRCQPAAEEAVGSTLEDHGEERRRIEGLRQAINGGDGRGVLETGVGLIYLLRRHFRREEDDLFPLAEKVLKPESVVRIERGFAGAGTFGLPAGCAPARGARRRVHRRHRAAS